MMKNIGFNFDNSYIKLPKIFYTHIDPMQVSNPHTILFNKDLMRELSINTHEINEDQLASLFSGNSLPENADPISMAYAGHQFGHFTLLGDGRAHLIGEHVTPAGKRFDIHLKGSGKTPYARRGDGRAALKPMLREYIISEAMHKLGIPTTRSLAVTITGDTVIREEPLTGAILTRIASSHIRIGTFEYAAHTNNINLVESLLDYTINRHYPDIKEADNKALSFLEKVIDKQSSLITHWMRVGFIHGVMNTDNMAISGETIDYGPCAFMDSYDFQTVFSSIDARGRYAYGNQPLIAQWNIARLAESLLPLINPDIDKAVEISEKTINQFQSIYEEKWLKMMRSKLGLTQSHKDDKQLISDLLNWMQQNYVDYTNCFQDLLNKDVLKHEKYQCSKFQSWYQKWQNRCSLEKSYPDCISLMRAVNPVIIPRNHHIEHALEAANNGNMYLFNNLLSALKTPYHDYENLKPYKSPPSPSERIFQTFCGT